MSGIPSLAIGLSRRGLLSVTANMAARFRKGMGITSASGSVSAWADQSGNGRDYAQAGAVGFRPVVQATGTILFDGSANFLKTAAFTLNQPFTRYFRIKPVSWTASHYIGDGNTLDTTVIYQNATTPGIKMYAGVVSSQNDNLVLGAWASLAVVFNGASSILHVSGTAPVTSDAGVQNAGGLTLGSRADGAQFANIEMAEEITYTAAHDAATRAQVLAYLDTL